jgi:hypothetical protein
MSVCNLSISKKNLKVVALALLFIFGISIYLLLQGQTVAVATGLFVIVAFLPIYLASRLVKSALLQMLVGFACISQVINVPIFVISKDTYTYNGWSAVRNFSFTIPEFVSIYSLLVFFLVVLVFCMALFTKLFNLPELPRSQNANKLPQRQAVSNQSRNNLLLLIVLLLIVAPLNLWMFSKGISLVGISPPLMPFMLVGILHYLTAFIVPLVLAVLYSKTSRAYAPAVLLMAYAFLLGATQVSKSAVLLVMLPVIYFAIKDRKYVLLGIAIFYTLGAIQIVMMLRNIVFVVTAGIAGADTTDGFMKAIDILFNVGLENFSVVDVFVMLANRIEGAQGIVLASQFNVDAIGGVAKAFKWLYFEGWDSLDVDSYHIEFIGHILPAGYMMVASGLLAKSLLITQSDPLYIVYFAINIALFLLLGEWISRTISVKYATRDYYYIVGGIYILFLYIGIGTPAFLGLLAVLMLISLLPRYSKKSALMKLKNTFIRRLNVKTN